MKPTLRFAPCALLLATLFSLALPGCIVRPPGDGYHHEGYYDDAHHWHGGYMDEHGIHHDDPPDWHDDHH